MAAPATDPASFLNSLPLWGQFAGYFGIFGGTLIGAAFMFLKHFKAPTPSAGTDVVVAQSGSIDSKPLSEAMDALDGIREALTGKEGQDAFTLLEDIRDYLAKMAQNSDRQVEILLKREMREEVDRQVQEKLAQELLSRRDLRIAASN